MFEQTGIRTDDPATSVGGGQAYSSGVIDNTQHLSSDENIAKQSRPENMVNINVPNSVSIMQNENPFAQDTVAPIKEARAKKQKTKKSQKEPKDLKKGVSGEAEAIFKTKTRKSSKPSTAKAG